MYAALQAEITARLASVTHAEYLNSEWAAVGAWVRG